MIYDYDKTELQHQNERHKFVSFPNLNGVINFLDNMT